MGGLKQNIECNLSIHDKKDSLFFEFYNFFNELWTSEFSINILNHGDLLEVYQHVYMRNIKATESKNKRLQKLRQKVEYKAVDILKSKREIFNEEFAYLLGLISAKSKINFKSRILIIDLYRGIANRGKKYEGYYYNPDISNYKISQFDAHKKDVDRIYENLNLLFKHLNTRDEISKNHVDGYHFQIEIKFDKDSIVFEEIKKLKIPISRTKVIPFIPKSILESKDKKIVTSFIRGYCDLKSRISISDGIYDTKKRVYSLLRMGISLPHGDSEFLNNFYHLLKKIGLKKGVSVTDPSKRSRENLIRISVRYVPYEILGTHWRRIFLNDFVNYMKEKK